MFDFIQNNRKLIQGILFLMFLPFVFFGVDSYFSSGGGPNDIATVGKQRITQQEFNQVLTERQNAIRNVAGGSVDPALLDSAELRFSVLDSLVRHRLLLDRALRSGMTVGETWGSWLEMNPETAAERRLPLRDRPENRKHVPPAG